MIILDREMSAAFEKYFRASFVAPRVEPEWIASRELIFGKLGWRKAGEKLTPQISINTDLAQKVFEHSAAHDIGHVVQFYEGYPRIEWLKTPTDLGFMQTLSVIAEAVTDLVTDADAERRLKPYGLWLSERYDVGFKNLKAQLPLVTPDLDRTGRPIYVVNSVMYAFSKTMLTESQWQIIGELYSKQLPATSNLGSRIYKLVCDGACNTAEKARRAYHGIFQELGMDHLFRFAPEQQ